MRNTYRTLGLFGILLGALALAAAEAGPVVIPTAPPPPPTGTVTLEKPSGPPVAVARSSHTGGPEAVACMTCHAGRTPNPANAGTNDLDQFHQGLKVAHGGNTCLSCHDHRDYGRLHLADTRPVAFTEVVTLCGQCHGPQLRDFNHGAHGGMKGAWDLTRGDRTRRSCTACHDPHAPKYQGAHPVLPPRDRFLESHHD